MGSKVQSAILAACVALASAAASAQTVQMGKDMSLTFHGFISATGFAQDQNFAFGNGQNAEYPVPGETRTDRWFGGGDVRNTRLTMVFEGPKVVADWKVGATLEMEVKAGRPISDFVFGFAINTVSGADK